MPNGGTNTEPDGLKLTTYDNQGKIYFESENQLHSSFDAINKKATPLHVSVWVQNERVRVWLNQNKLFDMPKAMMKGLSPDLLRFSTGNYGGPQDNFQYYISNIKIAQAAPDTRNKLLTEGKFSTTGISFDVNSDRIKPASYGVLKEIAGVLSENADVKVKIIGHTDSDGDDAKNLDLSKRRAASVKAALSSEFKIDASRLQTDGMGEAKPVGDNKTPEGKAQNRRVEFTKM
jgi:outer membrane protein OmpA-like peptidoglycan-associated protein